MERRAGMEIPKAVDDFLRESIQETFALPISRSALSVKLRAAEKSYQRVAEEHRLMVEILWSKEGVLERTKEEAIKSAAGIRKFVEENNRLCTEIAGLVSRCEKLEDECALYANDMKVLLDFGNETALRKNAAEQRAFDLETALNKASEELKLYKNESESNMGCSINEEKTVYAFLEALIDIEELESIETNDIIDESHQLFSMLDSLKPCTQVALHLARKVKSLESERDILKSNLNRAEKEAALLFKENQVLEDENKELLRELIEGEDKCGSEPSVKSKRRKSRGSG